ncbi:hypothetical protein [Nostoc sp.]
MSFKIVGNRGKRGYPQYLCLGKLPVIYRMPYHKKPKFLGLDEIRQPGQ